jgi:hypothetical protein
MAEMVDRIAKAILGSVSDRAWESLSSLSQESLRLQARAAIEAMREPTEAMINSPETHWDYSCHVCGGLKEGWYAFHDAALEKHRT